MASVLVAILALLALALAYAAHPAADAHPASDAQNKHAFVCTMPAPVLPGLRDATRANTCLAWRGEPWPAYAANLTRTLRPRLHDARRQERILAEFFSELLQADDVALLEREAQAMGLAYLDTNFTMGRRPRLLRNSVRDLMHKYSLPLTPVERKWTPLSPDTSPDIPRPEFLP